MKHLLVGAVLATALTARAQTELHPLVVRHNPLPQGVHATLACLTTDNQGMLLAGTASGIWRYDGLTWERIVPLSGVRSLHAPDSSGLMLVGTDTDFGYVAPGARSGYRFVSLKAQAEGSAQVRPTITRILSHDYYRQVRTVGVGQAAERGLKKERIQKAYFYSTEGLFVWNRQTGRVVFNAAGKRGLGGMFRIKRLLYVNDLTRGMHVLNDMRLVPLPGADATIGMDIATALEDGWQAHLAVSRAGGGYTWHRFHDDARKTPVLSLSGQLQGAHVTGAAQLTGTGFSAWATDGRGLVLANTRNQETLLITKANGLGSNRIMAMTPAGQGACWVATDQGLVYLWLQPLMQELTPWEGIAGEWQALHHHKGFWYVATTAGVFRVPYAKTPQGADLDEYITRQVAEGRKPSVNEKTPKNEESSEKPEVPIAPQATIPYAEKIEGLPGRVVALVAWGDRLVALGPSGPHLISGRRARALLDENQFVEQLWPLPEDPGRAWAYLGARKGLALLHLQDDRASLSTVSGFPATIYSAVPDGKRLVAATSSGLWQASLVANQGRAQRIPLPEGVGTDGNLLDLGQPVWLADGHALGLNQQGRWQPLEAADALAGAQATLPLQNGSLVSTPQGWLHWDGKTAQPMAAGATPLGPETRFARAPGSGSVVAYVRDRALLLPLDGPAASLPALTVQLHRLRTSADTLWVNARADLELQPGSVHLDWHAPEYLNPAAVQFQWRLQGSTWNHFSEWSPQRTVEINQLDYGSYVLELRARDALGRTSPTVSYALSIPRPWYLTWPALVGYGLLALGVGYAAFRLREQAGRRRLRWLEHQIDFATKQKDESLQEQLRLNDELERQNHRLWENEQRLAQANAELADQTHALEQAYDHLQESHQQLQRSEKLADVGRLVASAAHEIASPVSAAISTAHNLEHTLPASLKAWPRRLALLAESERHQLLKIVEDAAELAPPSPGQEERTLRRALQQELQHTGLPPEASETAADLLAKLGYAEPPGAFLALLSHPQWQELTQLALETVRATRAAGGIRMSLEKVQAYLRNLKNYVRHTPEGAPERFTLRENIQTVLTLFGYKHRGELDLQVPKHLELEGYPHELSQVWTNLWNNAVEALGGSGCIRIWAEEQAGTTCTVHVADDGPGIPPEVLPRIWDMLFTTKPKGQGTGIGLAVTKQIVEKHGGQIAVHSAPGGTTFSVTLPLATVSGPHLTAGAAAPVPVYRNPES